MAVSWADRFGASSAMDDDSGTEYFQAPPIGDLMRRFYSNKVDPETREAILTFFDYSYSQIPIIHPSTFIRRVVAKEVDPLLIDAIKAVSARYITANTGRIVDASEYSSSVLSQILFSLEQPSLEAIQALLIVALHLSGNERANSYYVLIGTATCLLSRLGWNELDLYKSQRPSTWEEWVEHETKRRIFWNVYQQDNFTSLIFGRTNIIPESQIHVRSPCADSEWNDITFALYDSATGETPEPLNENVDSRTIEGHSGDVQDNRSRGHTEGNDTSKDTWVWERKAAGAQSQTSRRVVISGAISHTFVLLCELNTLDSRIIRFLNDAKPSRYGQKLAVVSDRPFPASNFHGKSATAQSPSTSLLQHSAKLISEYPEFQKCTARLQSLFDSLKPPKHLKGSLTEPSNRKYFGGSDHGNFTARLRYLSIKSYICSRQIILHSSNRESFFEEFENPPDLHSVWPLQERENTDLPYTRYTFQLVLCVFLVTVIPLRQARRCKLALRAGDYSEMDPDQLSKELDISVKDTQVLWETLQKASAMWKTDFMCGMLRALNIEEVTGSMGQFSSFAM
ncbi:hypothetical protein EC988_004839 [Linderina pennispora]|nr:hypothetical protein EC988_004839 [Linderina pennispora]